VTGVRCQENRNDEMRMILFFLRPVTCHLRPDTLPFLSLSFKINDSLNIA
jgi:hypothetical protein